MSSGAEAGHPLVGVIMGSDSDLEVMQPAIEVLDTFGIAREVRIISAHRTPEDMLAYSSSAAGRGLRVIIAGAGGAAHLPGMIASATCLPVIGVPVAITKLQGIDALLSIAQMPAGVPVATVGVDNARNAGLLAVRILSVAETELRDALDALRAETAETVRAKDAATRTRFSDSSKESISPE